MHSARVAEVVCRGFLFFIVHMRTIRTAVKRVPSRLRLWHLRLNHNLLCKREFGSNEILQRSDCSACPDVRLHCRDSVTQHNAASVTSPAKATAQYDFDRTGFLKCRSRDLRASHMGVLSACSMEAWSMAAPAPAAAADAEIKNGACSLPECQWWYNMYMYDAATMRNAWYGIKPETS